MDSLHKLRTQWERVAAVLLVALGALTLVIGWFGASDVGLTAEQVPYLISGGLGGLFLMSVGSALWLSADLRDEWTKLDAIEWAIRELPDRMQLGADGTSLVPRHDPAALAAAAPPAPRGPALDGTASDEEPFAPVEDPDLVPVAVAAATAEPVLAAERDRPVTAAVRTRSRRPEATTPAGSPARTPARRRASRPTTEAAAPAGETTRAARAQGPATAGPTVAAAGSGQAPKAPRRRGRLQAGSSAGDLEGEG